MIKTYIRIVALLVILFITAMSAEVSAETIRMGFVGGISPETAVKKWSPLVDYLSRETGVTFEFVLGEDYQGLIDFLERGDIDLYEGGAFSHVAAMDTGIAERLVGVTGPGGDFYRSVLVVRKDSGVESIDGLKGKTLALTDELSTSGYVIPRLIIDKAGISKPEEFFKQIVLTGHHDKSLKALLDGAADVVGVGDFFLDDLSADERDQLRVIATSADIPRGPITVRKDLDSGLKEKIREALLNFHTKTTGEILDVVGIGGFTPSDSWDYETMNEYRARLNHLPKLKYAIPYKRIPTILEDAIVQKKRFAVLWMVVPFVVVAILLALLIFVMKRRISTSVGIYVAAIVAVFAAIFTAVQIAALFASINTFATKKLGEMENLNLRMVTSVGEISSETLDNIVDVAVSDRAIDWMRVFKNGRIIASSDPREVGVSVIDQIRTNTFNKSGDDTIQVLNSIVVNGRQRATSQIGFSFSPLNDMAKRAVLINGLMLVTALIAGFLATLLIRRGLGRPVHQISKAVDRLRESGSVEILDADADLREVTASISRLGEEMNAKQQLVELQTAEQKAEASAYDPEVTRLLFERFKDVEDKNPIFRKLRATEAVGSSPAWFRCLRDAAIRASDREPVVITGDSGSGKTGVARIIHALSPRAELPMCEFNCAELASADPLVVLGKLFGYGRDCGIQGIDRNGQKGILEEADGGTLFLDEVEIMPLQAQQLLLLPLEERAFNPAAGKGEPKKINVRFIFATNKPLDSLVHAGGMRHDFLRRIQGRGTIVIPPLSERKDDIELLARHFLALRNAQDGKGLSFKLETIALLTKYGYDKYNISELKGVVNQSYDSAVFDHALSIETKYLPADILNYLGVARGEMAESGSGVFDTEELGELAALRKYDFRITRAESELGYKPDSKTLTNHLRGIVYRALDRNQWSLEKAALEIGGEGVQPAVVAKIEKKVTDYVAAARRHFKANTASKLFNNLPQKYHSSVEKLLDAMRAKEV